MLSFDPVQMARRQLELDRERTGRFPHLLAHKRQRMAASPFAFLRGSAPLFYEFLAANPSLTEGPAGDGWIIGDLHLENFGAFRPDALSVDEETAPKVSFHVNDFDDATLAPLRIDVLRLTTSLLLGTRDLGVAAERQLALGRCLLESYAAALAGMPCRVVEPASVTALVAAVTARTRKQLLDRRTELHGQDRRFQRGSRYEPLAADLEARARVAFAAYVARLPAEVRPRPEAFEPIDQAFRVAGTGSLGSLRIAFLVRGKGGKDGAWVFDMKEERAPSASVLCAAPPMPPAERICTAMHACLDHPPRMAGSAELDGASFFVRRLTPQEDKLDWSKLRAEDHEVLVRYLGTRLGGAHRRGATALPDRAWSSAEREAILERAIALAGIHEAVHLALCAQP